MKILRLSLVVLGVAVLILTAGILTLRSEWFREQVRQRIIAETHTATNGRLEIGAFRFDWESLTATLDNVTLHGTEPEGEAPLFQVKRAAVALRIISLMTRSFSVARVELESPRGHLIVQPDGSINLRPPGKPDLGKVVDLRIGHFAVRDGFLQLDVPGHAPRSIPWNAAGENLAAVASYNPLTKAYEGDVSVSPVHVGFHGIQPFDAAVTATAKMERNRVTASNVVVKTAGSQINIASFTLEGFTAPVVTAAYRGRVALEEVDRVFRLINFRHTGNVDIAGSARFVSAGNYTVTGTANGTGLGYGPVRNISASGKFNADADRVRLEAVRLSALGGTIEGGAEVRDFAKFTATGQLDGFEARVLTDLAGAPPLPWNGRLSGPFHATGNLSEKDAHSLLADGQITVTPADGGPPLHGEIAAELEGASDRVRIGPSWLELPASRADFSGTFGERLEVKLRTRDLNELRPAIRIPDAVKAASGTFDGALIGPLGDPRVTGHAALSNVVWEKEHIDSLEGNFIASNAGLVLEKTSVAWQGLHGTVNGSLSYSGWQIDEHTPLKGEFDVTNGDIPRVLGLLEVDLPLTGTIAAKGQMTGTFGKPAGTANLSPANGKAWGEPYDTATLSATWLDADSWLLAGSASAGRNTVQINLKRDHSRLDFKTSGGPLTLDRIVTLTTRLPDLHGTARVSVTGALVIDAKGSPSLVDIGGEIAGSSLTLGTRNFGEAQINAATTNGVATVRLTSNAAGATLQGDGTIGLTGEFPLEARLSVAGLRLASVEAVLNPAARPADNAVEGSLEGLLTLSGPARSPDKIIGAIELTRVDLRPANIRSDSVVLSHLGVSNDGPVRMTLADSVVRVETAHFKGEDTSVDVAGQVNLRDAAPLDLRVRGTVGLALAHSFTPDLSTSGEVLVSATVRGSFEAPDFAGRAEVQNGEFRFDGFSNGLSKVKGLAIFNGTRATIQSLSGESGGGTVDVGGFASLASGLLSFRLEAKGRGIRVRYPEGISSVSDSDLTLAGTEQRSQVSGKVTVRRVSVNPRSDAASVLAQASSPIRTPASGSGLTANMNLDIQIETAPDVVFETSVAQSIQADASLRLRGTVTNPALIGRVNVTHGELVFFGNKYTITQGLLSFSDPARIVPVLNVDLETKARGVDVTLTVRGPISKLNVSYRSDPPLQFADVVALLATGRTPTAATLSTDTGQPQNFQQLGASALLGQALANPAADRLQRFFGVSRIKIDPQLTGITGSPEARLTIEQEVTPQLLFTYVSNVASTSTQLIRVEWNFSPSWGAILTREENGYVALDFAFRKRFK